MTTFSIARKAAAALLVAAAFALAGAAQGSKPEKPRSDWARLLGTWHLVRIDSPAAAGRPQAPVPTGLLVFTKDGHQAVQLMYPKAAGTPDDKFVHDGYEASFGTFEVDEAKHLLRYHPVASATRDALVGAEELLHPTFPDRKHLVIRPAEPDQHWSVTWERY